MSATPVGPIDVVRHARARQTRLSVDPTSGRIRLTIPPRAPIKAALRWAEGHGDWIAAQRARLPAPRPFEPGTVLTVADRALVIEWAADATRGPVVVAGALRCGGPQDTLSRRVNAWLRRQALDLLSAETAEFADRIAVRITRVAVGDAKGRWGSCASSGVIRYSWRLILAPGWVRRATVAHEVAHRRHMNHGPAFHALVAEMVGTDADASRVWLRANGAALHWFGRGS